MKNAFIVTGLTIDQAEAVRRIQNRAAAEQSLGALTSAVSSVAGGYAASAAKAYLAQFIAEEAGEAALSGTLASIGLGWVAPILAGALAGGVTNWVLQKGVSSILNKMEGTRLKELQDSGVVKVFDSVEDAKKAGIDPDTVLVVMNDAGFDDGPAAKVAAQAAQVSAKAEATADQAMAAAQPA